MWSASRRQTSCTSPWAHLLWSERRIAPRSISRWHSYFHERGLQAFFASDFARAGSAGNAAKSANAAAHPFHSMPAVHFVLWKNSNKVGRGCNDKCAIFTASERTPRVSAQDIKLLGRGRADEDAEARKKYQPTTSFRKIFQIASVLFRRFFLNCAPLFILRQETISRRREARAWFSPRRRAHLYANSCPGGNKWTGRVTEITARNEVLMNLRVNYTFSHHQKLSPQGGTDRAANCYVQLVCMVFV